MRRLGFLILCVALGVFSKAAQARHRHRHHHPHQHSTKPPTHAPTTPNHDHHSAHPWMPSTTTPPKEPFQAPRLTIEADSLAYMHPNIQSDNYQNNWDEPNYMQYGHWASSEHHSNSSAVYPMPGGQPFITSILATQAKNLDPPIVADPADQSGKSQSAPELSGSEVSILGAVLYPVALVGFAAATFQWARVNLLTPSHGDMQPLPQAEGVETALATDNDSMSSLPPPPPRNGVPRPVASRDIILDEDSDDEVV